MLKSIAVVTSGNDSPGMNATIRAVVRTVLHSGAEIWGVYNGYSGMIKDNIERLDSKSVSDIIQRGGTFLGTSPSEQFKQEEYRRKAIENLKFHGIEGLVVIGGDGSLKGAAEIAQDGFPVVGIPGTIANDIWGTEYTVGSDTASNTIVESINKLRDTACAHSRIILLEVMGNNGWLATAAGIAGGAEYTIVPEVKVNIKRMCEEIKEKYAQGKKYSIIVVNETAASAKDMGEIIAKETGIDTRVSVLGYIQRGGSPTVEDRISGSMLGEAAALGILNGKTNVMYGVNTGKIEEVSLQEVANNTKTLDPELVRLTWLIS